MDLLRNLNEQQRFAVTHTDGPMLILAGAGSGKTRTITHKIAYLIDQDICQPDQILAVTFTNKAADEMRTRVEQLLAPLSSSFLLCTFHSFAARVLRRHASLLGYRPDFTICDRDDQKSVLRTVYEELGVTDSQLSLRRSQQQIGTAKNRSWDPKQYRAQSRDLDVEEIFRIYLAYQAYLKRSNAVDFDDLILLAVELFQEHPEVRASYGERCRYLLIDEYQDTNLPQYELVKKLTFLHQNITAVGDEDQSIYGFRGADIGNILRFESDFAGALVVRLEQNYRSTQTILDAASSVVRNNVHRKGKVLWTENPAGAPIEIYVAWDAREEALFVSHRIHQYIQEGVGGLGVLYRTNFQSRQFEETLRRLQISYQVVGGVSFYNRKEIKDALAYLRVIYNLHDNVSLLRIINEPGRGIGRVTLDRLQRISSEEGCPLWEALSTGLSQKVFSGKIHRALEHFSQLIHDCRQFLDLPLHLCLEKTLETTGYVTALRAQGTEEADNRVLNLRELISAAAESAHHGETLQDFLDHAALYSEADEYDDSAVVTLMTLHNAKGLEFSVVFLVGCEDGLFPHIRSVEANDLEEERRLCYVGMTRAQKKLHLTYSRRRRFFGRESSEINQPSRFLQEIPEHLIEVQLDTPFHADEPEWTQGGPYESVSQLGESERATRRRRLVSGAWIVHEKYGDGRILQVENLGDDLKITVQFPGIGIKKMLQRYAKLRLR